MRLLRIPQKKTIWFQVAYLCTNPFMQNKVDRFELKNRALIGVSISSHPFFDGFISCDGVFKNSFPENAFAQPSGGQVP